jgi:hypothetical protein
MLLIEVAEVLIAALAATIVYRTARLWWKYRGDRVVACPENHRAAGVSVDTRHLTAHSWNKEPLLRLSSCSRWPERAGCGQECLKELAAAPEDCLVRNILTQWYAGKSCVSCGRPFGEIGLADVKPAVLCADKVSVEWSEIPAERIPETLAAAEPICFACHMGNVLVRTHPELAIDRHRSADVSRG